MTGGGEGLGTTGWRAARNVPFPAVTANGLLPCHSERSEESAVGNTAGDGARFEEIPRRYAPRNDRGGRFGMTGGAPRNDRGVASAFFTTRSSLNFSIDVTPWLCYGLIILSKPENREYLMAREIQNPNRQKSGRWGFVVSWAEVA
jgi:hypothetical protein